MCSKFSFENWWFQNDQWERCLLQAFVRFQIEIFLSDWSMINGPMREPEINISKKTCLNDCELCILLFQHRILWYHELSKYHLKLLSDGLPKNKILFYPNIYPKPRRFISRILNHIFTRYNDLYLTQNLTWYLKLIFYKSLSHRN